MNLTDEMVDEIAEEDGDEELLEPFTFEELPEPATQMSIYGLVKRDLHVDNDAR